MWNENLKQKSTLMYDFQLHKVLNRQDYLMVTEIRSVTVK